MIKISSFLKSQYFFWSVIFLPLASFSQKEIKEEHSIKYLFLSVGIFHDEKVPLTPKKFSQKGTFRKFIKLQYHLKEKKLRMDPKKEGVGTLFIINKDTGRIIYEYRFEVRKTNLNQVVRSMKSLLNDIDGISIQIVNNKAVVDGQVLLPRDIRRIYEVVKQFGDKADSLVTLSLAAQQKISRYIERAINNHEVRVRAINNVFLLEGWVKSTAEKDRIFVLAQAYMPDIVFPSNDSPVSSRRREPIVNLIKIKAKKVKEPLKKLIQIDVHYVELAKDYTKGFRFQWTPDLGDGSSINITSTNNGPGGIISEIKGTITNLLPKLNWARDHGHARVLKSTSIITQDGERGVIQSVTQIPYQTVGPNGQSITQTTNAGAKIDVTPTILGQNSDSIELKATFTISAFTGVTSSGGPNVDKRTIQTKLTVRSGQSAAVGGLISNDVGKSYNRLPANASTNPILSLYASKNFRSKQSQFVVFVTPTIRSSASTGADKIKKKFRLK